MNINGKEIEELFNKLGINVDESEEASFYETTELLKKLNSQIYRLSINEFEIKEEESKKIESLEDFQDNIKGLKTNLEKYQDKWEKEFCDEERFERFVSYIKIVEKAQKVTDNKTSEKIEDIIKEIVSKYFITLIDALYENIDKNSDASYKDILAATNEFLSLSGIYTKIITENQLIDYNYMEPILENKSKETNNNEDTKKVKEVKRYAYFFKEETEEGIKIINGKVKI